MSQRTVNILFIVLGLAFFVNASTFIVDQRYNAIVFQLGSIDRVISTPGLHWNIPFVQNVRFFDKRILTIDNETPSPFNTKDKQNVIVDSYVKWQIADVRSFYKNFGGDPRMETAVSRVQQSVNTALYAEIGRSNQNDVIGEMREKIMQTVRERVNVEVQPMGVKIVDVRMKRVDYSQKVSDSVFQRMQAERKRVANELRSRGAADSISIRAEADREKATILAEAYGKAQEVKGRGDAEAAAIYAQAFSAHPEFYKFYRSLEAYKESFKNKSDVLVLQPDSEFFRYFRQPAAK